MITKFETSAAPSQSGSGSGSNTLLYVVIGGVLLYLGYKYIYLPEMEKRKLQQQA